MRQAVAEKLRRIGQDHLLNQLSSALIKQVEALDETLFLRQLEAFKRSSPSSKQPLSPPENLYKAGDQTRGEALLKKGAIGCLVLAGGEGSRLNWQGPKGSFPVGPLSHKSLFARLIEKRKAASQWAGRMLPMAVMCSRANREETEQLLKVEPEIHSFSQGSLPLLDNSGNLFLVKGALAEGADGNGRALFHFVQSGSWQEWWNRGVRYLLINPIDNPLADPYDTELVGLCNREKADVAARAIERSDSKEKVGLFVQKAGKTAIIEYLDLSEKDEETLHTAPANTGLFCLSMDFVKRAASISENLPLHSTYKSVFADRTQKAWKSETYLFDLFPLANSVVLLLSERSRCFAPLKELSDLNRVRAALLAYDRRCYQELSGLDAPNHPFELAAPFYYPTAELLHKWRGRKLPPDSCIEP